MIKDMNLFNSSFKLHDVCDIKETNLCDYNCTGYALGIAEIIEIDTSMYNISCDVTQYTELITELLCKKYSHIREIHSESELSSSEILVMFRAEFGHEYKTLLSSSMLPFGDVHFIHRNTDGQWMEKLGKGEIRRVPYSPNGDWKIDLDEEETLLYTGPISLLAVHQNVK